MSDIADTNIVINNSDPIIIPATAEKTFPNFWVSKIIMDTPSKEGGKVYIELNPYNAETKEILNQTERVFIQDFWSKSKEIPEISIAIQAILTAVNAIKNN
jgi:hypothetical protein